MILDNGESIYLEMDLLDMDHAAFVIYCASHSFQEVHLFASTMWSLVRRVCKILRAFEVGILLSCGEEEDMST